MTTSLIGHLPVGVRAGTSEAREAGLRFVPADQANARAAPKAEFGFDDFIDLINPLQHLPIIGTIYRALTGDAIEGPARILGGALYGGPVGLAFGVFDAIVEDASGKDVGGHVYSSVFGDDAVADATVAHAPTAVPADPPLASSVHEGLPALPAVPVQASVAQPVAPPAITGYQDALDAMAKALDRYDAQAAARPRVDASY